MGIAGRTEMSGLLFWRVLDGSCLRLEHEASSEMGRKGGTPLCSLKSAEVDWNQGVVGIQKTGVCRRLKGKDLREGVFRRWRVSSQTSIASSRVLVNDDLVSGNSKGVFECAWRGTSRLSRRLEERRWALNSEREHPVCHHRSVDRGTSRLSLPLN